MLYLDLEKPMKTHPVHPLLIAGISLAWFGLWIAASIFFLHTVVHAPPGLVWPGGFITGVVAGFLAGFLLVAIVDATGSPPSIT